MNEESKCPVTGVGSKSSAGRGPSNRDWWPNQLNLKMLHQNQPASDPMRGDARDVQAERARYRALLAQHPPDACVLGIGENGHLAFNDPPADFATQAVIHVVELDERCRGQQVGEGHFGTLDDVPPDIRPTLR